MSNNEKSIREFLKLDSATQNEAWYDWFCKNSSLPAKTVKLVSRLRSISLSPKIDLDKNYVFFKNNCPGDGRLYDDFRICDRRTGDVIYTVVPSCGYNTEDKGKAMVYGRENEFEKPLTKGTWKDIKNYFLK